MSNETLPFILFLFYIFLPFILVTPKGKLSMVIYQQLIHIVGTENNHTLGKQSLIIIENSYTYHVNKFLLLFLSQIENLRAQRSCILTLLLPLEVCSRSR